MSVIDLQAEREARANEAFLTYTQAKARADRTRHLRDMAEAVRAWDTFITLAFPEPSRREALAV